MKARLLLLMVAMSFVASAFALTAGHAKAVTVPRPDPIRGYVPIR